MLVPIKVKICRCVVGDREQNDYPPFNELPSELRGGQDWRYFVDRFGGWHYDKLSGFGEADDENPDPCCQYGCLLVPEDFALEASRRWPGRIELLDEAAFERFHDERAHAHEGHERVNARVLEGLRAKYGIPAGRLVPGDDWDPWDRKALDPDHPSPGVVRNHRRTYQQLKARRGLQVHAEPPRGGPA